jgi:hypothetical protein
MAWSFTPPAPHIPLWCAQEKPLLYNYIFPTNNDFCLLAHLILLHKMYVFSVVPVRVILLEIIMLSISLLIFCTSFFLCFL